MKLGDLVSRIPGAALFGPEELALSSIVYDSRAVQAGALFAAIRGVKEDGNVYVDAALKKGAAAVLSERPPRPEVPWLQVPDAREGLAAAAACFYGDPARALTLVGVTGTNGKTTTAFLTEAALRAGGHTAGLLGTVIYRIGERVLTAVRTTPESSDLQALFRQMLDLRCSHAVLEVSSHSLVLKRVHGCDFAVAVFTNLTRDHLDFHGDMESYFAAKRVLFDKLLRQGGHAIINADDDWGVKLAASLPGRNVWTYSLQGQATLRAEGIAASLLGTRFIARTPAGDIAIDSPLLGLFNVRNLLAAMGAALAAGVEPEAVRAGLSGVKGVPGRLERVEAGQDFTIVVDYAHTDDALKNLLETVRALGPRRVITVFGCGGDRDRTKRPLMGAVASRLSDVVIVTSDNPRREPPETIIEEIERGIARGASKERHRIVDRREAISRALALARAGDVVVIAGKGHETYQTLRDRDIPFDDRQVARELLAAGADGSS